MDTFWFFVSICYFLIYQNTIKHLLLIASRAPTESAQICLFVFYALVAVILTIIAGMHLFFYGMNPNCFLVSLGTWTQDTCAVGQDQACEIVNLKSVNKYQQRF